MDSQKFFSPVIGGDYRDKSAVQHQRRKGQASILCLWYKWFGIPCLFAAYAVRSNPKKSNAGDDQRGSALEVSFPERRSSSLCLIDSGPLSGLFDRSPQQSHGLSQLMQSNRPCTLSTRTQVAMRAHCGVLEFVTKNLNRPTEWIQEVTSRSTKRVRSSKSLGWGTPFWREHIFGVWTILCPLCLGRSCNQDHPCNRLNQASVQPVAMRESTARWRQNAGNP